MINTALPTLHPHLSKAENPVSTRMRRGVTQTVCSQCPLTFGISRYLKVVLVSMFKGLHCLYKELTLEVSKATLPTVSLSRTVWLELERQ